MSGHNKNLPNATVLCQTCGRTKEVVCRGGRTSTFCSRRCANNASHDATCVQCGRPFKARPMELYCSDVCRNKAKWLKDREKPSVKEQRAKYHHDTYAPIAQQRYRERMEGDSEYAQQNRERAAAWAKANPDQRREQHRRARSTAQGRLDHSISSHIRVALAGRKAGRQWERLVGYTLGDLVTHLEARFAEGMSWENYGRGQGCWHVDHIRPRATFCYSSPDDPEFLECWALSNLQPLWEEENLAKGARYDREEM